jgi:NitT/TauT family transport system substrate-binding protein
MKRNLIFVIIIAIAIVFVGIGTGYFLFPSQNPSVAPEHLTLGLQPVESSALLYIAKDRGFFSQNGLDVTIRDFDPPVEGVNAMLRGEVDLDSSTEYPIVLNAFNYENISILSKHVQVQSVSLIGRRDRGITNISDLPAKTIGVNRGTLSEFYLGRFLILHGMNLGDVTVVDVRPPQFAEAISDGRIDALVSYEPYLSIIRGRMGNTITEWPANSGQPAYGVITARNDWIGHHPDLAVRFLKSLDMAEGYTTNHPAEAKVIVQKRLNLSDDYIEAMWPRNQFSLSLDQSLVLAMEDEARWMIANNMTNATAVPDFGRYIYTKGLDSVKPGSVNIIR